MCRSPKWIPQAGTSAASVGRELIGNVMEGGSFYVPPVKMIFSSFCSKIKNIDSELSQRNKGIPLCNAKTACPRSEQQCFVLQAVASFTPVDRAVQEPFFPLV